MQSHRPASPAPEKNLAELIAERSAELLRQAASSRRLTEDLALALLERRDLPVLVLEDLSKNHAVLKHRRVINALVVHPRTPRHVSMPIIRRLYTFELMQIALTPVVPADLKMFCEEQLIGRLESISSGERLSLARRGSTRIAAALLLDAEARVIETALQNPHLVEEVVVKAIANDDAPCALIEAVSRHQKWSLRRDVRAALLRNEKTPMARVITFAEEMSTRELRHTLLHSRLPKNLKTYLEHMLEERAQRSAAASR
jgi:hypothetical protein